MTAASPPPLMTELRTLARSLVALEKQEVASDGLGSLPRWIIANGPGGLDWRPALESPPPDVRSQLVAISRSDSAPAVRALAAIQLASAQDPDDMPHIEALLGRREAAFSRPAIHLTQQVQIRYTVYWTALTLEDAGLLALSIIVGRRFGDVASYRSWVEKNENLERSFDYQHQRLKGLSPKERLVSSLPIRAIDPALFWRLIVHNSVSPGFGIGDADLLPLLAKDYGPAGVAKLLRDGTAWPEFERSFQTFVRFVLDRGDVVFAGDGREVFKALFDDRRLKMHDHQRGGSAVVLSRLYPERGLQILRDESVPDCDPKVQAELIDRFSPSEDARIAADFYRCDSVRDGCLDAIAKRGAASSSLFRTLLLDDRFDQKTPNLVARALKTARALGAPDDFPQGAELYPRFRKGGFSSKAEAEAAERRSSEARRDTVARIRSWLRTP